MTARKRVSCMSSYPLRVTLTTLRFEEVHVMSLTSKIAIDASKIHEAKATGIRRGNCFQPLYCPVVA